MNQCSCLPMLSYVITMLAHVGARLHVNITWCHAVSNMIMGLQGVYVLIVPRLSLQEDNLDEPEYDGPTPQEVFQKLEDRGQQPSPE